MDEGLCFGNDPIGSKRPFFVIMGIAAEIEDGAMNATDAMEEK